MRCHTKAGVSSDGGFERRGQAKCHAQANTGVQGTDMPAKFYRRGERHGQTKADTGFLLGPELKGGKGLKGPFEKLVRDTDAPICHFYFKSEIRRAAQNHYWEALSLRVEHRVLHKGGNHQIQQVCIDHEWRERPLQLDFKRMILPQAFDQLRKVLAHIRALWVGDIVFKRLVTGDGQYQIVQPARLFHDAIQMMLDLRRELCLLRKCIFFDPGRQMANGPDRGQEVMAHAREKFHTYGRVSL